MSWTYRIIRTKPKHYVITEVYDKTLFIRDGVELFGETPEELQTQFAMMREAFDKPVLHVSRDRLVEAPTKAKTKKRR